MEIANGKENDGIAYVAYLRSPNWIVIVTSPEGEVLSESFPWHIEPKCGPDVIDVQKAEVIMEKLITRLRNKPTSNH